MIYRPDRTIIKPEPRVLKGNALREKIRTVRGFGSTRILGQKPWPKQLEIERAIFDGKHKRTEISGCVGSTKTYALAMTALVWLMSYKPSRVFSLAPSFRQVNANLWGYMKKLWNDARANGTPIGDQDDILQVPKINLGCRPNCELDHKHVVDWYYEGFTTDDPGNVHGLHGPNDLVILDDGQGIRKELSDELENITAGGNTKLVMAYNKMMLHGPTYDCRHREAGDWNHVGIAYSDLVQARKLGFELPGALGADAEKRWAKKYGRGSNFFRVKVLNLDPKQEKDTLIPLEWIEAAYVRGERGETPKTGFLVIGGDVGGQGTDASALAPARGRTIFEVEEWHEDDTMVTTGKFVARVNAEEAHEDGKASKSKAFAFIDSIGIGAGVVNRMAELDHKAKGHRAGCRGCEERIKVEAVNGSETPIGRVYHEGVMKDAEDVFRNKRSQVWWNLRELLNPANAKEGKLLALTRSDDLTAQLSCIRWRTNSGGLIEVEPKKSPVVNAGTDRSWGIIDRLGFSPNQADAVSYAAWGLERIVQAEFAVSSADVKQQDLGDKFAIAPLASEMGDSGAFETGVDVGGLDGLD